jgi:hypothetical protein
LVATAAEPFIGDPPIVNVGGMAAPLKPVKPSFVPDRTKRNDEDQASVPEGAER